MLKITSLRYSEWSLKRKLFVYMLLLAVLLLLILFIGLMTIGRMSSTADTVYDSLELQMEVFEKDILGHFDHLAASAVALSTDMTEILTDNLQAKNTTFPALNDHGNAIADLQEIMIEPLKQKLLQTDCSGAFVMLNATVNSTLPEASSSKTGLYLQVSGYDRTASDVILYRGITDVAKSHKIMPHRKWRLEFTIDLFPDYAEIVSSASMTPQKSYRITEPFKLPGTSEYVLLVTVPMLGNDGTLYGICGYEVSASYFMMHHEQPSKLQHLSCLLAMAHEDILITSESLSCGSADAYFHTLTEDYAILKNDENFSVFQDESFSYLGITRTVSLSQEEENLLVVMIPKNDYDLMLSKSIIQTVTFLLLFLFFTVSFCRYFSKRFLTPLLTALEQIKSDKRSETASGIPEILDLVEYLDQQDKVRGEMLTTLEQKNLAAENEKLRIKAEYDRALCDFHRVETEYTSAKDELLRLQSEMERLAYSRKTEIDPADYQYFLAGLQTLTESERNLFEYYLAGKSVKEILALIGIKESTLKYHNHNLLGKLGVSSRKQMLRYAEIMRYQKEESAGDT
ncbi:MAG: hypothetical protein IJA67_14075 [Oscillospiraceae bacterium]|nr:hypothetical protein [Oscillospiraceae bacterium]